MAQLKAALNKSTSEEEFTMHSMSFCHLEYFAKMEED
jgi:hypothetical protein